MPRRVIRTDEAPAPVAGAPYSQAIAASGGEVLEAHSHSQEADASPDMPRIYRSVANERIYDDDVGGSRAQPPMAMDT